MTRIPDVTALGARQAPNPVAAVERLRPGEGGMAEAQAMIGLGRDVSQMAGKFAAIAKEEKEKADTLRAEDAFNKLREKQLEYTFGEGKGFTTKKGGDAVNGTLFKDYDGLLNNEISTIAAQLENDEQRNRFLQRANISRLQFQENILRHVAGERETYAASVYDGTINTEARAASAQWNDPTAVATSLLRSRAAANAEADRKGIPKEGPGSEPRLAMVQGAESKIHGAVLGQMLATGDYRKAAEYFKEHRENINPELAKSVQKAVEDGAQKQQAAAYNRFFTDNMNNRGNLLQLQKTVDKDPVLDDTRKQALYGRIAGRIDTLDRKAEAERDRAFRQVEKTIDQVNAMTMSGWEPSVQQFDQLINVTRGTPLEAQVRSSIQLANQTRQYRLASPQEQEQAIAELTSRVRQSPTPDSVRLLNAFQSISQNQRKDVQENPVGFAVRQGLADAPRVDLTNPGTSAGELSAQVAIARGVAGRYNVPLRPLQPEQVATMKATLETLTPAKQVEYFGQIRSALGSDSQAYSAIMGQLAKDNPVLAVAGDFQARGRGKAASDMLRGWQILHPNKREDGQPAGKIWPMPKGKDEQTMATLFTDYTSGALKDPNHRNAVEQSARAIYAAKVVDAGDDSGTLNTDLWKQSIKEATGGIEKYRGQKTILPYGMEMNQFRDGLYQRIDQIAKSGRLNKDTPPDRLRDLPVDAIGDGRYVFRVGDSVLVGTDGKPLIINFNAGTEELPTKVRTTRKDSLKGAKGPWER